jgi:hypothetical protein
MSGVEVLDLQLSVDVLRGRLRLAVIVHITLILPVSHPLSVPAVACFPLGTETS